MRRFADVFFILCFLSLALFADEQAPAEKPEMVIEQEVYDAGEMYRTGDKIEHAFVIRNRGSAALNIYSATPG